jgi:hypothetical protein
VAARGQNPFAAVAQNPGSILDLWDEEQAWVPSVASAHPAAGHLLEVEMKKLALAAALAVAASSAYAGGVAEPVMTPEEVTVVTTSSSAGGLVVPLLLLLLIGAAVASN